MPWSNQTGSGGRKGGGGNGGGPWGQGPQPPRPGGSGSPDLEEILRRGQDRLRRAIPGGGNGGGSAGGIGGVAIGALVVIGLAAVWAMNAIHVVEPGENGVKVFLGKPREELSPPGLHVTMWPLESFETVPAVENRLQIGSTSANDTSGLMLSGDQNIVDVKFSVLSYVSDPQAYLFKVDDAPGMLRHVSESAMREVVGRNPVDDLFRDDRAAIAEMVRNIIQQTLNNYGAGITINAVSIEETAPPTQVASAFEEVQRATQDQGRFVDEANIYRNQQLGRARGEAAQINEDSIAYKNRVIQEAVGESQRFSAILQEYERAPDITRRRLYLETLEGVMRNSNKVITDDAAGGNGVVPYLPLTELDRLRAAPRQTDGETPNAPAGTNAAQGNN
ncbi:FtsH protease activity modulator HflK [Aureimonas fodinaquatilis]|uniref:Protein HflK n=1 Tax=Aureimonas fodinaquatilis TaxID=2565783 RepID=A0A5B0E2R9_9HYPH|nr:FtsH protease activity modulator HflK [Aureimonas fodinaquatilis]KAA0972241.1 FtsH protease activity modulator HflK [Aureimonas fodinaquatilis]